MRFATYTGPEGRECVGAVCGGNVHSLPSMGVCCGSMLELIENAGRLLPDIRNALPASAGVPLESVGLLAPIPHPRHDILCVGLNYLDHGMEAAKFKGTEFVRPEYPVYFSKRASRCVGHGEAIPAHADVTRKLDYEAELAVIIGRRCQKLRPEEVFHAVFGFTVANDVSARDLQNHHVQYTFAKGLDGFAVIGPWIVTADEFSLPLELPVISRVNGELRQNGNTAGLLFDIPFLVSQLSQGITLEPGDILLTGTPAGVGMGFQPPRFLKAGDVVECEIPGIGILRNPIA